MTGAEMDAALAAIGWTRPQLAAAIGHRPNTGAVGRWARGEAPIPAEVATWLLGMAELHRDNPPPQIAPRPYRRPDTSWLRPNANQRRK